MSRRLVTDAKIVLERANCDVYVRAGYLLITYAVGKTKLLTVEGGTVDNAEVVKLLEARGFDEHGYHKR